MNTSRWSTFKDEAWKQNYVLAKGILKSYCMCQGLTDRLALEVTGLYVPIKPTEDRNILYELHRTSEAVKHSKGAVQEIILPWKMEFEPVAESKIGLALIKPKEIVEIRGVYLDNPQFMKIIQRENKEPVQETEIENPRHRHYISTAAQKDR
jgi:hypothetical protein